MESDSPLRIVILFPTTGSCVGKLNIYTAPRLTLNRQGQKKLHEGREERDKSWGGWGKTKED